MKKIKRLLKRVSNTTEYSQFVSLDDMQITPISEVMKFDKIETIENVGKQLLQTEQYFGFVVEKKAPIGYVTRNTIFESIFGNSSMIQTQIRHICVPIDTNVIVRNTIDEFDLLEKFLENRVETLIMVNENEKIVGTISLFGIIDVLNRLKRVSPFVIEKKSHIISYDLKKKYDEDEDEKKDDHENSFKSSLFKERNENYSLLQNEEDDSKNEVTIVIEENNKESDESSGKETDD